MYIYIPCNYVTYFRNFFIESVGLSLPNFEEPNGKQRQKTGRPRAICGQRYPLPCFAWLCIGVKGSRAAGLKGMQSCRTQGDFCSSVHLISLRSKRADLKPESIFEVLIDEREAGEAWKGLFGAWRWENTFQIWKADFRSERAGFSLVRVDFRPERADFRPETQRGWISGLGGQILSQRSRFSGLRGQIPGLRRQILGHRGQISGQRGLISGLGGQNLGPKGQISGLKGLLRGGRMNKLTYGQTNKSPSPFYRTLSPLGPLSKKTTFLSFS